MAKAWHKLGSVATVASLPLLAACAAPEASLSSKGNLAFEAPEELCNITPTPEMVGALRMRSDYVDILLALEKACPAQMELYGIGATASVPSLEMDVIERDRDYESRISILSPAEDGRDVTPPAPPATDDTLSEVVTDPPAEGSAG